jgi:hypothetical protein
LTGALPVFYLNTPMCDPLPFENSTLPINVASYLLKLWAVREDAGPTGKIRRPIALDAILPHPRLIVGGHWDNIRLPKILDKTAPHAAPL